MVTAVLRGTRSLMVRGLVEEESGSVEVSPVVLDLIDPFIGSGWTQACFSYATVASFPASAGGVRVFSASPGGEWYLDEVSAFGVHSIRSSSRAEFESHARAFTDVSDDLYPATGGARYQAKPISVYSRGIADEFILKAEDGFYLAGPLGRDDLPLTFSGSEFAFAKIDGSIAAERLVTSRPGA